jgi:SAM-dependent methyltransferase
MTAPPADHALRAYEVFAAFYDEFTREHDMDGWTGMLEALANDAGLAGTRLLDVACGTGESFMPMLERGYAVCACDVSPAMVERARAKAGGRAAVSVQDMRDMPRLGSFDLVWCLGDALNYLHGTAELVAAFEGMRRNLDPDGVVVFDVNTLATFRRLYSRLWVWPDADRITVLDGHGSEAVAEGGEALVWLDRLSRRDDGSWARERSVHRHRHHPLPGLDAALRHARLEPVGVFGSSLDGVEPGADDRRHIKAVFTARHLRA